MSVLIDPYMFLLKDEKEITDNVEFFRKVIRICTNSDANNGFRIAVYVGMLEKINQMPHQPFPINLDMIQDIDLKNTIMQINSLFVYNLLPVIEQLDIDSCDGGQEFGIINDSEICADDNYFEMLYMLLIPCYSKEIILDKRILTGIKSEGKQIGDRIQIRCLCPMKEYEREYLFAEIEEFISDKDKVVQLLKEKINSGEVTRQETVLAEMGTHHNRIQAKSFKTLKDLTLKNKRVFNLLREFGMSKIIFGEFTTQGVKATGTMQIHNLSQEEAHDILQVKFNAETGFQLKTDLYFPKGVGALLQRYFQREQMIYENVYELKEAVV